MIALGAEQGGRFGDADCSDRLQRGKGNCHIGKGIDTGAGEKLDPPAMVFGKPQKARFIIFLVDGGEVADRLAAEMEIGQQLGKCLLKIGGRGAAVAADADQ